MVLTKKEPSVLFFTKSKYRIKHAAFTTPNAATYQQQILTHGFLGEPLFDRENHKDMHNTEGPTMGEIDTSVILYPELLDTTRRLQHLEQPE